MLTNVCLIFGQPILGRGIEINSTQRTGLAAAAAFIERSALNR